MPYALRRNTSGELLAARQINVHGLEYFGVLLWPERPDETECRQALEKAGAGDPAEWTPCELTEHEAKMANVKLRNDPSRRVFLRGGVLEAEK